MKKLLIAGVASLMLSSAASAGLILSVDGTEILDRTPTVNTSSIDFSSVDGKIVTDFDSAGGLTLEVETGLSWPRVGATDDPDMNLSVTASGSGSSTIMLTHDFTGPISNFVEFLSSYGLGGTIDEADVAYSTYIGTSAFDLDSALYSANLADDSIVSKSGESVDYFDMLTYLDGGATYWITLKMDITLDNDAGTSHMSTEVPEPASIALLGLGLLGMVAARRRRA